MEYYYENNLLQLKGISGKHSISDIDIYIGTGILQKRRNIWIAGIWGKDA